MNRCQYSLLVLLVIFLTSCLWAGGDDDIKGTCSPGTETEYTLGSSYSVGSVLVRNNLTGVCVECPSVIYPQFILPGSTYYQYIGEEISNWYSVVAYPVTDIDGRITNVTHEDCTEETLYADETISVPGVFQNTSTPVPSPGNYDIEVIWDDGHSDARNDASVSRIITLSIWTSIQQGNVGMPLTPGQIYRNGQLYDNKTVYVAVKDQGQTLNTTLSENGVSLSGGSDIDYRLTMQRQLLTGLWYAVNTVNVYDSVCIMTTGSVDMTTPGVYPVQFTWYDLATTEFSANDADSTKQIVFVVVRVKIVDPVTPKGIAINNYQYCRAEVEPAGVLPGGNFSWYKTGGDGDCDILYVIDPNYAYYSNNPIYLYGTEPGYVDIKVKYTCPVAEIESKAHQFVIFSISLLNVGFNGDHQISSYEKKAVIVDPVWDPSTSKNDSISYTKDSPLNMTATFLMSTTIPATDIFFMIGGLGDYKLEGITLSGLTCQVSGFSCSSSLPNTVGYSYEAIEWNYSTDFMYNWSCLGDSGPHLIFRTYSNPVPTSTVYDFALLKACGYAEGKNATNSVVSCIRNGINTEIPYNTYDDYIEIHPLNMYYGGGQVCSDFANLMACLCRAVGFSAIPKIVWGGVTENNTVNHKKTWVHFKRNGVKGTIKVNPGARIFYYHAVTEVDSTIEDSALNVSGINVIYTAKNPSNSTTPYPFGGENTEERSMTCTPFITSNTFNGSVFSEALSTDIL